MTVPKKDRELLGKGIRSLLQNIDTDLKATDTSLRADSLVSNLSAEHRLSLSMIVPNPNQPRKDFEDTALSELAASIKLHNIIQPLTVTPIDGGKYMLIAGERRYRASKIAGLKDVPVYIREAKDSKLLELSLLENLQREDLNAIEIGLSYKRLMDDHAYTQEQVSERIGKERSTIANYIRLLKLPPDIQVEVRSGNLSMGHARALLSVDLVDKQLYIFSEIKAKKLSVRQTEELARKVMYSNNATAKQILKPKLDSSYKKIEDSLASNFNTKVKLTNSKNGSGSILFEYYSLEELNGLLDKLNIRVS